MNVIFRTRDGMECINPSGASIIIEAAQRRYPPHRFVRPLCSKCATVKEFVPYEELQTRVYELVSLGIDEIIYQEVE